MSGDERPQKMRKLSHQQDKAQIDGEAVQNISKATESTANEGTEVAATTTNEAVTQDDATTESLPAPAATATPAAPILGEDGKALSKNQQKKLRRKQEWEDGRADRKVLRKEKVVAKRERAREAKAKRLEEGGELPPTSEERRARHILRPVQLPVTIILDCDFDDLMRDNERVSLAQQITRCYSDNKNSKFRAHLTISSFGGHLRERFDGLLNGVYKSWRGTRFLDEDFVETAEKAKGWMTETNGKPFKGAFAKYASLDKPQIEELKQQGEIVYLSSESDETLTELKPYSTYIVGGLVDKNREKGICHKRATQRGVRTAKLPIGDYLDMSSRKVLATNHVNQIMVQWLECGDWGKAFMAVMPARKGGKLREDKGKEGEGEDGGADAEEDEGEVGAEDEKVLQDQVNKASELDGGEEANKDAEMDDGEADAAVKVTEAPAPAAS